MKFVTKLGLALVLAAAVGPVQALEIQDAQDILGQLDRLAPGAEFSQHYVCGDQGFFAAGVTNFSISCTVERDGDGCMTQAERVDPAPTVARGVFDCVDDTVNLFWDAGRSDLVTRDEYEHADHRNELRLFLSRMEDLLGYQGRVILRSLNEAPYLLRGRAGSPSLPAYQIEGSFIPTDAPAGSGGVPVLFTLLKDGPGVARFARFRIDDITWFRLVDWQAHAQGTEQAK